MDEKGRQTRKSARRDAFASGKRFDAVCRPFSSTLRVALGSPTASSKASPGATAPRFGLLLAGRAAQCDDDPILVRNSG